jgi:hypothetical protein
VAAEAGVSRSGGREPPRTPEARGFARHINAFVEDPALWPLVFIFVVHIALAGALLLLAAARERSLPALGVLALLLMLSVDVVWRARRRRRAVFWVFTLWAASAATAIAASRYGLL